MATFTGCDHSHSNLIFRRHQQMFKIGAELSQAGPLERVQRAHARACGCSGRIRPSRKVRATLNAVDALQTALSLPSSRQALEFVSLAANQWGGIVFLQPSCCVLWSCLGPWGVGGGVRSSTCSAHSASDKETAVSYWPEKAKARTGLSPQPLPALYPPRAQPRDCP